MSPSSHHLMFSAWEVKQGVWDRGRVRLGWGATQWLLTSVLLQGQASLRLAVGYYHESLHSEAVGVQEQTIREVSGPLPSTNYYQHQRSMVDYDAIVTERSHNLSSQRWKLPRKPRQPSRTRPQTVILRCCRQWKEGKYVIVFKHEHAYRSISFGGSSLMPSTGHLNGCKEWTDKDRSMTNCMYFHRSWRACIV